LSLERGILEHLLHVAAEDAHIILVVHTATINGVFEDSVDFLPCDVPALALLENLGKDLVASLQVTVAKLVVFGPALGDELSTLLNHGVEPGEDEEKLHFVGVLTAISRGHILERPLQVVFHARGCLIGDLET